MKYKLLMLILVMFVLSLSLVDAGMFNVTHNVTSISYHLYNGTNSTISDDDFTQKIDITSGLSDNDDATTYLTTIGLAEDIYAYYKLNELAGTYVSDSSGNNQNGTTMNMEDADWQPCKLNNCLEFDGVNEYVNCGDIANFERTDAFSIEFWFKSPSPAVQLVVTKAENAGTSTGWAVGLLDTGEVTAYLYSNFGLGNRMQVKTSASTFLDGAWYHIIFTYDGSSAVSGTHIYVDGVDEPLTTLYDTLSGSILNSVNCQISGREGANHIVAGQVDEVLIYETEISQSDALERYNDGNGIEKIENAYAVKPYFNFSIDILNNYWLMLNKNSSGNSTFRIYPYINETDINKTNYINRTLNIGWNNISINDIIYNAYNLGYRIISQASDYILEAILIEQINDSIIPSITDCVVNNTALNCDDWIRLSCNITDVNLNNIYFGYNDSLKHYDLITTNISDVYYKDLQYTYYSSGNETLTFINATADDLANNINITYPSLDFNYECLIDITSPTITLISPTNNTINNTFPLNITFTVTDNSANDMTCILTNSTYEFDERTFAQGTNYLTLQTNLSELTQEFANLNLSCYDNDVTYNNSATMLLNYTIDKVLPLMTIISPALDSTFDKISGSSISIHSTCYDTNIYRLNISIYNSSDTIFSEEDRTAVDYTLEIDSILDISSLATGTYTKSDYCADSHTRNYIADYSVMKRKEDDKKVIKWITPSGNEFELKCTYDNGILSYGSYKSEENDKYVFYYNINDTEGSTHTITCELENRKYSVIHLPHSEYNAHFIMGNNWIDFEIDDEDAEYYVSLNQNNNYEIEISTTKSNLVFSSVGELNIVEVISQITITYHPEREDEFVLGVCPISTVSRTILFMFFIVISFAIIMMGYTLRNGLIGTIGSLMFIGLGVYMWYCLAFVSLLMMMLGVILMTFFIFKGVNAFR